MPENQNLAIKIRSNPNLVLFIIGFSIIMIMAGMFYLGAAYSCKNSNGELLGSIFKLKCNKIDIIGVCEYQGKYYVPYNITQNKTINL